MTRDVGEAPCPHRSSTQPVPGRGLVLEISSRSTRKTDLFAKPGEYAEVGIPLFWRVDRSPELRVHAFVLGRYGYEEVVVLRGRGTCPTPWGEVTLDLDQIRTGGGSG